MTLPVAWGTLVCGHWWNIRVATYPPTLTIILRGQPSVRCGLRRYGKLGLYDEEWEFKSMGAFAYNYSLFSERDGTKWDDLLHLRVELRDSRLRSKFYVNYNTYHYHYLDHSNNTIWDWSSLWRFSEYPVITTMCFNDGKFLAKIYRIIRNYSKTL